MSLEQLAMLAIAVFAFMAIATSFSMFRSVKRVTRKVSAARPRRLLGSEELAWEMAKTVVGDVVRTEEEVVAKSRELGMLTAELEELLTEAESYYLGRVESRYRSLFTRAVNEIILMKTNN